MMTDLMLAAACQYAYSGATVTWGTDTVHAYTINAPGNCIVAFEGTSDFAEWMVDFDALPEDAKYLNHIDLGCVHRGWWNDIQPIVRPIITHLKALPPDTKIAITGHSKGAPEALYTAALCILDGVKLARVSTFGTPHCGRLGGIITPDLGMDYQCGDDPVANAAFFFDRPRPITKINAPNPIFNTPDWGIAKCHHTQNYIAALKP